MARKTVSQQLEERIQQLIDFIEDNRERITDSENYLEVLEEMKEDVENNSDIVISNDEDDYN